MFVLCHFVYGRRHCTYFLHCVTRCYFIYFFYFSSRREHFVSHALLFHLIACSKSFIESGIIPLSFRLSHELQNTSGTQANKFKNILSLVFLINYRSKILLRSDKCVMNNTIKRICILGTQISLLK